MTIETVRSLKESGIDAFNKYLNLLRSGGRGSPPKFLLNDSATSEELPVVVSIEERPGGVPFRDRFAFGKYLSDRLSVLDPRSISRLHGLWTWLALYYFDQLCVSGVDGSRRPLDNEAYVLSNTFKYDSYYRHLVRTPWLSVIEHGENSKVLLMPAGQSKGGPLGQRGEILEQLASRQSIFGNQTIIGAAYKMYFDEDAKKPKRGSGGAGAGSPRRLALITQQLDLTFDLRACDVDRFIGLLPKEFNKWRQSEQLK